MGSLRPSWSNSGQSGALQPLAERLLQVQGEEVRARGKPLPEGEEWVWKRGLPKPPVALKGGWDLPFSSRWDAQPVGLTVLIEYCDTLRGIEGLVSEMINGQIQSSRKVCSRAQHGSKPRCDGGGRSKLAECKE